MKPSFKEIQELKSRLPNECTLIANKCSIVRICKYCGNLYVPTHFNQKKFCSRECFHNHRLDYKAEWKRTKYNPKPKQTLGTGYIDATRQQDFDKEEKIIKKELRRLRIKR